MVNYKLSARIKLLKVYQKDLKYNKSVNDFINMVNEYSQNEVAPMRETIEKYPDLITEEYKTEFKKKIKKFQWMLAEIGYCPQTEKLRAKGNWPYE